MKCTEVEGVEPRPLEEGRLRDEMLVIISVQATFLCDLRHVTLLSSRKSGLPGRRIKRWNEYLALTNYECLGETEIF